MLWRQTKQGSGIGVKVYVDLHTCKLKSEVGSGQLQTEKATFEQRPKLIREGDTTAANGRANPKAKSLSGRSLSLFEADEASGRVKRTWPGVGCERALGLDAEWWG